MASGQKIPDKTIIWRLRLCLVFIYCIALYGIYLSTRDQVGSDEIEKVTLLSVFVDSWIDLFITNSIIAIAPLLMDFQLVWEQFQRTKGAVFFSGAVTSILLGLLVLDDVLASWSRFDSPLAAWQKIGWAFTHWLGIYIFLFLIPLAVRSKRM